ncbi:hypothetical protein [Myroides odoratimimus]|uniref:hypothetical protein n=1 Tax=Myroides odoratimimus TaxID=76832 RepID=UPI002DBD1813|nr:hypothetical protein [Myroides odoratimimus]MEC4028949.1 hypothetical protein [Myroides odoratimimus]
MIINKIKTPCIDDECSETSCEINCIHIRIEDFQPIIEEFRTEITDTCWINKLDAFSQLTFNVNVQKTINKIVNDIIAKVESKITVEIGEYIVSYSALKALKIEFNHTLIPLAELLKEKVSGNPGFDFHSISEKKHLIFGEAKFSLSKTSRALALNQIALFIDDRDHGELLTLAPFLTEETKEHLLNDRKGYSAAFSYNGNDLFEMFNKAVKSDSFKKIIEHKELYLIAVEIC